MAANPHPPSENNSALLDLRSEMAALVARDHGSAGRIAQPIANIPGLRIVLVSMKAGSEWKQHSTPARITVQPLAGELRMRWQDHEQTLGPGRILVLAGGVVHNVAAVTDAVFLLTVARPQLD